jgi:hypothetical protein
MGAYGDDDGQRVDQDQERTLAGALSTLPRCRAAALHPLVSARALTAVFVIAAALHGPVTGGDWAALKAFGAVPAPDAHHLS